MEQLRFRGTRWQNVRTTKAQDFFKNTYRVILTRAREGRVIFVPMQLAPRLTTTERSASFKTAVSRDGQRSASGPAKIPKRGHDLSECYRSAPRSQDCDSCS